VCCLSGRRGDQRRARGLRGGVGEGGGNREEELPFLILRRFVWQWGAWLEFWGGCNTFSFPREDKKKIDL
jgi:hypothetical protein